MQLKRIEDVLFHYSILKEGSNAKVKSDGKYSDFEPSEKVTLSETIKTN
jgi:hypothetical protein